MTRRIRGLGRGRKTRRTLERGGTGAAHRLNTALGGWPGVRITPMFGRWGYFVGETLFACFPVREKEHDLWIRLRPDEQRRALAAGVVIGLTGFAVGGHEVSTAATWKNVRLITLIFNISGACFAFVVGGWVAVRIAGFRRADPAVLHGAIAWLVTLPILMLLAATDTLASYGGWLGSLAGFHATPTSGSSATDMAAAMRKTALANRTGVLVGLMGSVIGGWIASGEPMTLRYYRRRGQVPPEETLNRPIA